MSLYEKIVNEYPELIELPHLFIDGTISLRNDGDEIGDYIEIWNYEKPIPNGLKIGK